MMRPLALAYHGLAAVPPSRDRHGLFVAPRLLRRHVHWLRRRGYRLVTFGELVARSSAGSGDGYAALTFDDGLADNLALIELGVPATVFAVSGWLGGEHPEAPGARMLSAEGLRRLYAAGVEIGGHTASHADLTRLGSEAARDELARGRAELEAIVDAPVTSAAYPYGRANAETVRACSAAGFLAACRTTGEGSFDSPLDFPREDMTNGATLLGLRLKAAGRYEPLMRHRPARAVRRAKQAVLR
jgi:peptidoglycan/xylan/chitin deacetylase (PgdA/CDA1 family)